MDDLPVAVTERRCRQHRQARQQSLAHRFLAQQFTPGPLGDQVQVGPLARRVQADAVDCRHGLLRLAATLAYAAAAASAHWTTLRPA
ncbi:MAG TPA: hypothetical protein VFH35_06775, partial [Ramlibacter sp.]|nr:hypothetical protein [Ramlibacter sp.]